MYSIKNKTKKSTRMKKRIIETGECQGLTEVSKDTLLHQERKAKSATEIPVKQIISIQRDVKLTPEGCMGDMETCQIVCGACIYDANAPVLRGTRTHSEIVLDTAAYLAKNPATKAHLAQHPKLAKRIIG